ncbi:MAG: M23 family metallopeptidase [Oscillospiraceae bacterium]|nr:M23 family metallopeptidase [Oscillospiraceae bacterium]
MTAKKTSQRATAEEPDGLYSALKFQIFAAAVLTAAAIWIKGDSDYQTIREQASELMYCETVPTVSEIAADSLQMAQERFEWAAEQVNASVYEISKGTPDGKGGSQVIDGKLQIPAEASLAAVVTNAFPLLPVEGYVTSLFGYRVHPITGQHDFHMGMDIAAKEGTEVLSALPGTVTDRGVSDIYGNYVTVEHAGNFKTRYCHLSQSVPSIGDNIRRGARIGKVGSTGMSTGPHLHFDVIVDGKHVNPIWILEELKEYRWSAYTSGKTVEE